MNTRVTGFFAGLAVLLTALGVWYAQRPAAPAQASWEDVQAEARRGGYELIATADLAARYLADPASMVLVDTRQEWEYRTGHIEGALNFPMEPTWWARWRKAGELERLLGPDRERPLVFY